MIVALLIGLGIALRLFLYLGGRSLWIDEASLALTLMPRSYPELLEPLGLGQGAPIGFLLIERIVLDTLGSSELALRLVPLLCGIASLFLFHGLASRLLQRRAALLALALFAIAAPLTFYSTEFKQYSSDVMIALLLWRAAVRFEESPPAARRTLAFGLLGGVAVWFSHPAIFVLAASAAISAWRLIAKRDRSRLPHVIGLSLLWGAGFVTNYLIALRPLLANDYLRAFWHASIYRSWPPTDWAALRASYSQLVGLLQETAGLDPQNLAALFAVVGFAVLYRRHRAHSLLLALPFALLLVASALHRYPHAARLALFAAPAFILFVAEGLARVVAAGAGGRARRLLLLLPAIVLVAGTARHGAQRLDTPRHRRDIRRSIEYVQANWRDGDLLYLFSGAARAYAYYGTQMDLQGLEVMEGISLRPNLSLDLEGFGDPASDLERLRRRGRVWVLYSHGYGDEIESFLATLDTAGKRIDAHQCRGAAAYLYQF